MAELKLETLGVLSQIWNDKGWTFPTSRHGEEAFDKLCKMLEKLEVDEQGLVLNLMRCYSHYSFNDYQSLLIKAFQKIDDKLVEGSGCVIIVPLVGPDDLDKNTSKSGHSLVYVAHHIAVPMHPTLCKLKVMALATPAIDIDKLNDKRNIVILVDDFVGSGDTAEKAVAHLRKSLKEDDVIVVVCLVTMMSAVARLAESSIPFFWAEIVPRGIEGNEFIHDKACAYSLIDGIWKKYLKISEEYKRGYKNSEALVSLLRTPNNTLPMYWVGKSRDKSDWPSPFSR